MKASLYCVLCGLCGSLYADGTERQESGKIIALHDGIYAGIGLVAANEKYDFSLNSNGYIDGYYKLTNYLKTQRSYNGQLFIGYQLVEPILIGLEFSYTLNKANIEKVYSAQELPNADAYMTDAFLNMKYGNDLALKLKVGKSFSIGVGKSCHNVAPYIIFGIHERTIKANFDYVVSSQAGIYAGVDDFSFANHSMKSRKLAFIWGLGISMALEKEWTVSVEYNCQKRRDVHHVRVINGSSGLNYLDMPGMPRHYSIKGKNTHTIAICLSKMVF